jgi:hypothetical protein
VKFWERIRIPIHGSVPLAYRSGSCSTPDPIYLVSHKIVKIKVITFLLVDGRIRISDPDPDPYKIMTDPAGPKTYESGSKTLLSKAYAGIQLMKRFALD